MTKFVHPLLDAAARDATRFGPKTANQALLAQAGLPTPGGFCLDAAAYWKQIESLGLGGSARAVFQTTGIEPRRHALRVKLGLMEQPIAPEIAESLLAVWRTITSAPGIRLAVRSSALVEDRLGSSFAGQFESYLGVASQADFLTAVRACWAALWSSRALRYMAGHNIDPAETAMAVLIQPLVEAYASGGGLSQTADDCMILSATPGLGSAIAQGEVVPDHIELGRDGSVRRNQPGRPHHQEGCGRGHRAPGRLAANDRGDVACLSDAEASELGQLLLGAEELMGRPVEIEWAKDDRGFTLLQARPLHLQNSDDVPDEIWLRHPHINGQPSGVGWGQGRACVVTCECELGRIGPGDILVTQVPGPALAQVLPMVNGVVAELGGSTSHLASLARERGVPMVLGVLNATRRIPDGATVAVDGMAGVVRWMR